MDISIHTIFGTNRLETHQKERHASRGIIVQGQNILMAKEMHSGHLMIPGGGMEKDESPENCCLRELEEETGLLVQIKQLLCTVHEFYTDYKYISYYFLCCIIGDGTKHLTSLESERGLAAVWMPIQEAVATFEKHLNLPDSTEEVRGVCQRELTALYHFLNIRETL